MLTIIQARSVFQSRSRVVDVHVECNEDLTDRSVPSLEAEIKELPLGNFLNPPPGYQRVRAEWTIDRYGKNIRLHAVDEPTWMDPDADEPIVVGSQK